MWIMLNDAFLSIVKKDCPEDHFLVRARRPGDIEKVFGRRIAVERLTDADYLFRARIPREEVEAALVRELGRVTYGNFKDTVKDHDLHVAYLRVWTAMAGVQHPAPYSQRYRRAPTLPFFGEHSMAADQHDSHVLTQFAHENVKQYGKRPVSRPKKKGPQR